LSSWLNLTLGVINLARSHSKDSVFKVDDSGGTLRDISGHVDNVSGLPGAPNLSPVTSFGDQGEKSIRGIEVAGFTVSGQFDTAATTGSLTVLNGIRTTTTTASFEYGPEGGTTGKVKYSGEAWLEDLKTDAAVGNKVPFTATFKVDGIVTVGTFA
jgi:hypothetical protein